MFGGGARARCRPRALRPATAARGPRGPAHRPTDSSASTCPGHRSWTRPCFPLVAFDRSSSGSARSPSQRSLLTAPALPPSDARLGEVKAQQDRFIATSAGHRDRANRDRRERCRPRGGMPPRLADTGRRPGGHLDLAGHRLHQRPRGFVPYIGATAVHSDPGFDRTSVVGRRPRQRRRLHPRGIRRPRNGPRLRRRLRCGHQRLGEQDITRLGADRRAHERRWRLRLRRRSAGPSGRLAPDPDPIGCGGKDVNPDIEGADRTATAATARTSPTSSAAQIGVAPGVEIQAVKVCSAVSTACSGVALLLAMDYALDPNGDGVTH